MTPNGEQRAQRRHELREQIADAMEELFPHAPRPQFLLRPAPRERWLDLGDLWEGLLSIEQEQPHSSQISHS